MTPFWIFHRQTDCSFSTNLLYAAHDNAVPVRADSDLHSHGRTPLGAGAARYWDGLVAQNTSIPPTPSLSSAACLALPCLAFALPLPCPVLPRVPYCLTKLLPYLPCLPYPFCLACLTLFCLSCLTCLARPPDPSVLPRQATALHEYPPRTNLS